MGEMNRIMECIPNFSEGRDQEKMEKILQIFRSRTGVRLLDCQNDENHNRMVVTVAGAPEFLGPAVVEAIGKAVELIDMTKHQGQHPRMGAADVVPFVPIRNTDMAEAVELSRQVAKETAEKYDLPVFLYEASATVPERRNLANIRRGQFEGMAEKLRDPAWKPDFGPARIHPTAGVAAIGARKPLVAFNVNLDTDRKDIADAIAGKVRHISGGLRYCKAMGIEIKDRGMVQISMNLTDYEKTALYTVFEMVRIEARRYGIRIVGSEIVGLAPMAALIDTAAYYLGLENFSMDQVLEARLLE